MSEKGKPTVGQILAALLAAALVPALLVGVLSLSMRMVFLALLVTAGHAVVLGLPLALILRRSNRITQATSLAGGFVVGCFGIGVWAWPLKYAELKTNSWRGSERTQTMVDGLPTLAGWMDYIFVTGAIGFFGLIGGAIFWAFLSKFVKVGAFRRGSFRMPALSWRQRALIASPFLLLAVVVLIPSLTKDRTCHNMFRDSGVRSVSPRALFAISTDWSDSLKIQQVLAEFASRESLSFRNDSENYSGGHRGLHVSLCNESGTNISIHDYYGGGAKPGDEESFSIGIYARTNDPAWPELALRLRQELEAKWPGEVTEERR